MCVSLAALMTAAGTAGTGTAVAAPVAAAAGSSLLTIPTAASIAASAPTAAGVAGSVAAAGGSGVGAGIAGATAGKVAGAVLPGLVTPLLLKPKMPKLPATASTDPVNSAAKARMAAKLKAAGAYGKSSTVLTGGSGAAPTGGQKLTLGA